MGPPITCISGHRQETAAQLPPLCAGVLLAGLVQAQEELPQRPPARLPGGNSTDLLA